MLFSYCRSHNAASYVKSDRTSSFKERKNNAHLLSCDTKCVNEPLTVILLSYSSLWIPHLLGRNGLLMKAFISDTDANDYI